MSIELKSRDPNNAKAFLKMLRNPQFKYFHAPPESIEKEREVLETHVKQIEEGDGLHYDIWVDGILAGGIGSERKQDHWQAGYFLDEKFWGRGIIPQALAQLEQELWANGIKSIKLDINIHNTPSIRVAEKCGYVRREEQSVPDREGKDDRGYCWEKGRP